MTTSRTVRSAAARRPGTSPGRGSRASGPVRERHPARRARVVAATLGAYFVALLTVTMATTDARAQAQAAATPPPPPPTPAPAAVTLPPRVITLPVPTPAGGATPTTAPTTTVAPVPIQVVPVRPVRRVVVARSRGSR